MLHSEVALARLPASRAVGCTPWLPRVSDLASWSARVEPVFSSLKALQYVIYFNPHSYFKLNYFTIPSDNRLNLHSVFVFAPTEHLEMRTRPYGLKQGTGEKIDVERK